MEEEDSDDKAGDSEHTERKLYDDLHIHRKKALSGGCCIVRGISTYAENNSCSYRWQACYRAVDKHRDRKIYYESTDDSATPIAAGSSMSRRAASTADAMRRSGAAESISKKWKDAADGKEYAYVVGKPFRTCFSPWENNAHHLIPVGQLIGSIEKVAGGDDTTAYAIAQALTGRKYNVNHWVNMMILPQRASTSIEIGLPTHPGFRQVNSLKGMDDKTRGDIVFHFGYSEKVGKKVESIIRKICTKDGKVKCKIKVKEGKNMRRKLEELSDKIHDEFVASRAEFIKHFKKTAKQHGGTAQMSLESKFVSNLLN